MVKILVYRPKANPVVEDIDGELESLQKIVEGNIESVQLTDELSVICNEEGKVIELPPLRWIPCINDHIHGPFLLAKYNEDVGLVDLTPADINFARDNILIPRPKSGT